MPYKKIYNFTDLEAWNFSIELLLQIYPLISKFPKTETFVLCDQIRRACISISSNIAEGFERSTYRDKIHFYNMASGSCSELKNQLIISYKLNYLNLSEFETLITQTESTQKLIKGLIRKSKQLSASS